jgi:integrase
MGKFRKYEVGQYRLGWLLDEFCVVWDDDGKRRRFRLGTSIEAEARSALDLFARQRERLNAREAKTIEDLFRAYLADKRLDHKPTTNPEDRWKALKPTFGHLSPSDVDKRTCRRYAEARITAGRSAGTAWSDLVILRAALNWAERARLIDRAPYIWLPQKPGPRDKFLTRDQATALLDAAVMPHVRLFVVLAITTAGREGAILDLTWDRVNFETGLIDLYDPTKSKTKKGRAVVPMNAMSRAALAEARPGALTPYVIEWAGKRVRKVRVGLVAAGTRAGLPWVSPHVLRHSAARWMAEDGVPMTEIASYLGHTTSRVTEAVYAKFSPQYLSKAGASLTFGATHRRVADGSR